MKTQPNECYSDTAIARELGIPFNDIYEAERNGYLRTVSANESPALAAEGAVLGRDLQAWIGAGMPISTNENAIKTGAAPAAVVQTSGAVPAKGENNMSTVIQQFEGQVAAAMNAGLSRQKAVVRVAKQHPELHSEYVKQTDAQYKAAQGRK